MSKHRVEPNPAPGQTPPAAPLAPEPPSPDDSGEELESAGMIKVSPMPSGYGARLGPVTQIQSPLRYDQPPTLYMPRVGEEGNPLASSLSTRFQEGLRRVSQARELPVLNLLSSVQPTVELFDFAQTEYRILRADNLVSMAFSSTGAGAQFATAWVVNNVPNSLLVVDELIIAANVTGEVLAGKISSGFPAGPGLPLLRRDLRVDPSHPSIGGYVAASSEAAVPGPIHSGLDTLLTANTPFTYHPDVVLLNGYAIFISLASAGTNVLTVTVHARTRLNVEKTELENFPT
jgi:hypothetical protein